MIKLVLLFVAILVSFSVVVHSQTPSSSTCETCENSLNQINACTGANANNISKVPLSLLEECMCKQTLINEFARYVTILWLECVNTLTNRHLQLFIAVLLAQQLI